MRAWWAGKARQTGRYLRARVALVEREAVASELTPAQLALFDAMHVADQRHGLDVRAALVADGVADPELLLAALLHDAAKGPRTGLAHRIGWSLAERHGRWVLALTRPVPGFNVAYRRLADHAEASAELALRSGCSARTAALIRAQAHPTDESGRRLARADEAW